jgi:hypothetical protein
MGKIPAALIVIVLLTTVASVAVRPLLSTANAVVPGVVIGFKVGSNTYSVDVTSMASLLFSPETAISAVVHGIQNAAAEKPDQATEPINAKEINPGESVHITHLVENQAVTVSVEVTVNVGEPASVTHTTEPHPPEPDRRGSD